MTNVEVLLVAALMLQGMHMVGFAVYVSRQRGRPAPPAPSPTTGAFQDRVRELVLEQNARWPDRSGQAKHHQVYGTLVKEFPDVDRTDVVIAIAQSVKTVRFA